MKNVINLYKPTCLTPLQAIQKFKINHPKFKSKKIGFAGRLDPMAEGVLLVLVGSENKKAKKYIKLEKEYDFDVLFGLNTDTYDILGKITSNQLNKPIKNLSSKIKSFTSRSTGKINQSYPPYSSVRVNGRPLFYWARKGKINEVSVPTKQREVFKFQMLKRYSIEKDSLREKIIKKINTLEGDFRQKAIIQDWQHLFLETKIKKFRVYRFSVTCSSGTYIRSLVHEMGKFTESGAIALNIKRTNVGNYLIKDSIKL